MAELHSDNLRNTDNISVQAENGDSTIERILADIERLTKMLSNELDQNKSLSMCSNSINFSSQQKCLPSLCCSSLSTTITNVTIEDEHYRHIEHLRHRIARLEHERHVLLTSYQLLIELLK